MTFLVNSNPKSDDTLLTFNPDRISLENVPLNKLQYLELRAYNNLA